ncbi:MAG: hypothetical protein JWM87_620 [Candidatus Eremiobacteraeota bacterium]|nr:hypothetical protein [Candidatus Eremiobacteraeota bacterium]
MLVIGAVVAARELAWSSLFHADQRLIDFGVFWCGGRAALDGASPYLFEPLRSCEHQHGAGTFNVVPNFVMPFVLPPFDIAPFAQLARMPYGIAAWFFTVSSGLALVAGIALVAKSCRVPATLAAAGLSVSVGLPSLWLGQIVPLELLALSATAYALVRRWDGAAGAFAVLCLLEPHVGAFVVISVAVLVPRARLALVCGSAVLAYLSVRAANVAPLSVYIAVLAEHARAEAGSYGQYSLTSVLTYLRAPLNVATALGVVSSVVMLGAGLVLSRAFEPRGVRAAVVYIPAMCAVIGGTFVHLTQIALAVPAALLVHAYARDALARRLSALALVLLAVPWPLIASSKQTLAAALLVLAVTAWYVTGRSYRAAIAVVAAAWIALVPLQNYAPAAPAALPRITVAGPSALASDAWKQALDQMTSASETPRYVLLKLPTWLALAALLAAAITASRRGGFLSAGYERGDGTRASASTFSAASIMSEFSRTFFSSVGPISSARVGTPKS